jgi:hypothetical protein
MLKNIIEGSLFLKVADKIWRRYLMVVSFIEHTYRNSVLYKAIKALSGILKACIGSSRIIGMFKIRKNILAINDSLLISYFLRIYGLVIKRVGGYTEKSRIITIVRTAQKDIYYGPLRSLGLMILAATLTNTIVSLLLGRWSGPMAWFMRTNLVIIGTIWVSCKVDLEELKKTSVVFRLVKEKHN